MNQKQMGLYIHIPFCKKKCYYCDFSSYSGMEDYWEPYVDAVVNELAMKASEYKNPVIDTVFIGGGTPSLIPQKLIWKLLNAVHKYYRINQGYENTIEANPGTLSDDKLQAYKEFGINRISIGLQACQDDLLNRIGRIHSHKDFLSSVELAQKYGFKNINADIIFGIPDQSFNQWQETIETIVSLDIPHVSCYSLIIEEDTMFGKMKKNGELSEPDEDLDREMYYYAVETLAQRGFIHYEISNFAKPNHICRHNMNYWRRGHYIGAGAGAHSFIDNRRFANTSDVVTYIDGVKDEELQLSESYDLDTEDAIEEFIFLGIRLEEGIDLAHIEREFGINIEARYRMKIDRLVKQGLVECKGTLVKLTKQGLDLANRVILELV